MRFLADENVPGECVAALKLAGHDVVWVRTAAPGITDAEVLAWAAREERLLLIKTLVNLPEDPNCCP